MKSQTPGAGQAYLGTYTDAAGHWLDGGHAYTLKVPADVPAEAVLVGHRLRHPNAVFDPQRSAARRPRVTRSGAPHQCRRFGRRVLRSYRTRNRPDQLDPDDPGPALVLLLPALRPARAVFRPKLEARRHHPIKAASSLVTTARLDGARARHDHGRDLPDHRREADRGRHHARSSRRGAPQRDSDSLLW